MKLSLTKITEWMFYLFIFLLPWQTRYVFRWGEMNGRWEYGDVSVFATDIILGILLVLMLVWRVKCQMSNDKCQIKIKSEIRNPKSEINPKSQISNDKYQMKSQIPNPNVQTDSDQVVGREKTLQTTNYKLPTIWWIIALFELVVFLSIFWSHDKGLAVYGWLRILVGIGLFWLVITVKFRWKNLIYALVLGGMVQGALGIYQFVTQSTFASKWLGMANHIAAFPGVSVVEFLDQRWLRAYGALPHPNVLAGFLVICFLLLLGLALVAKKRGERFFILAGLVTILPGLFFTFSRGAWVALAVGFLLLVISLLVKRKKLQVNWQMFWQVAIIALVILAFLTFRYFDLVDARFSGTERLEVKSNIERLGTYKQAIGVLDHSFPWGVGVNNYTVALHDLLNDGLESWSYQPVHNVYILILAEVGIFGFLLWLLVVLWTLFVKVPSTKYQVPEKNQVPSTKLRMPVPESPNHLIASTILFAILIIMLFDHYFWSLSIGIYLFWLVLGLIMAKNRQ